MQRKSDHGVALLEALIAIALVAVFLTGALIFQSRAAGNQRLKLDEFLLTEFAHGKIEERITGGEVATDLAGSSAGGWNWEMTETDAQAINSSGLDGLIVFKEIKVDVWHDARPGFRVSASTVVARRRP